MLNKAEIIGNVGAQPKMATTQTAKVASFSVATTEKGYTTKSGTQVADKTEWHNVVCFGRLAEVVEKYINKGMKVYVSGKMRTRTYEDKQGIKRSIMEIHAETMEMLDSKIQQSPAEPQHNDVVY